MVNLVADIPGRDPPGIGFNFREGSRINLRDILRSGDRSDLQMKYSSVSI